MPNEIYILLGTAIGALGSYISASVTMKNQTRIAALNTEKDLQLQAGQFNEERLKEEVKLEREELKRLHLILSRIALENSQTMSFIQNARKMDINEYRERYLENCHRLHEAQAIADLYYPEMSKPIREIYGQSNMFWGNQEAVLSTDIAENKQRWDEGLGAALQAGNKIGNETRILKDEISRRGKQLSNALLRAGDRL